MTVYEKYQQDVAEVQNQIAAFKAAKGAAIHQEFEAAQRRCPHTKCVPKTSQTGGVYLVCVECHLGGNSWGM